MRKSTFLLLTFLMVGEMCNAQDTVTVVREDSLIIQSKDTVLLKTYSARYDPRKALLYAAIIPGLGQIYNKKYWKLPLVYGGFIGIGYGINFYQEGYIKYKKELYTNIELGIEDNETRQGDVYTTSNYRKIVDQYKRERDFMIILMGGMYLLQMVDAHVDAHLKEFDLNPNLQVSIEPMMEQNYLIGRQTGVSLIIKF